MLLAFHIKIDIIIMEFEIKLYKDSSGKHPIEDFLLKLAETNEILFSQTTKGLEKLRNRAYHKEPLSKYLEPGLWELRIIYTFAKGQLIILLHIFIKKTQKVPRKELEMARKRLKEIKMKEAN